MMNVEFEDTALEDLFLTGTTSDKKYRRLSQHYEKKGGNLKDTEAVWINDQYRLLFKSSPNEQGIIVNALLTEISKHYE